mmetsp:Transcript_29281/g.101157  ORF Transcript_29281/g.101157 Transcript_29281/m.101157 type:complete len:229 (+) Transcript_29281:1467-2153(+)
MIRRVASLVRRKVQRVRAVVPLDRARVAAGEGQRGVLFDAERFRPDWRSQVARGDVRRHGKRLAGHREPVLLARAPDLAAFAFARFAKRLVIPIAALPSVVPHHGHPVCTLRAILRVLRRRRILPREGRDWRRAGHVDGDVARGTTNLLVVLFRTELRRRDVFWHERHLHAEVGEFVSHGLGDVMDKEHDHFCALAVSRHIIMKAVWRVRRHQLGRRALRGPEFFLVV